MPTYEYRCNACKHEFEVFQSMTAKPISKCPACGKTRIGKKPAVQRLIGIGAAVLFKGSGFYQTDYRTDSYKKAAESEHKAASSTDSKSDTKPDTKPDSKPDAAKTVEKAAPATPIKTEKHDKPAPKSKPHKHASKP